MQQVTADVEMWRERANYGIDYLRKHPLVDSKRIAAIGYCFGGGTVLQLAYGGTDIAGVVSFHGALPLPTGKQATKVKAKMLIAYGNADPFQKEDHIRKFRNALEKANVDWQMVIYAGARHSFTDPGADARGIPALKYSQTADERSWKHMQLFFEEIFYSP